MNKRLLKKISFILILSLIPLLVFAFALTTKDDSGVLHIILCSEDSEDGIANEIINKLLSEDNIMTFEKLDDIEKAYDAVKLGTADAAWIFKGNMQQLIDNYAQNGNNPAPIITVIERETDISMQLSHEKLAGCVFPYISYSIFENFLYAEIFTPEEITKEQLKDAYDHALGGGDLVAFESLSGEKKEENVSYLTAPLRGILSLVVVLCGLAAVMYHQSDRKNGIYDWLPKYKHVNYGLATCFSAVFDSTVFVVISLALSGMYTDIYEIPSAVIFVFATTAFCSLIGCLTKNASVTGKLIPFIMIILLVISPIFFNLDSLQPLQRLLPTYYYLYSVYSHAHILYMAAYSVIVLSAVYLINYTTEKNA